MISAGNALDPGPGNRGKATFRRRPFIIRFERLTVFQASGSVGGHDFFGEAAKLAAVEFGAFPWGNSETRAVLHRTGQSRFFPFDS